MTNQEGQAPSNLEGIRFSRLVELQTAAQQIIVDLAALPKPSQVDLRPGTRLKIALSGCITGDRGTGEIPWDFIEPLSLMGKTVDFYLVPADAHDVLLGCRTYMLRESVEAIMNDFIIPVLRRIALLRGQDVDTVLWATEKVIRLGKL